MNRSSPNHQGCWKGRCQHVSQHMLLIKAFDKSQSINKIINAGGRFQSDIFHNAHILSGRDVHKYKPQHNNASQLFQSICFLSWMSVPWARHCPWVVSWGSIFRGAVVWLVGDARRTGGKHPGVGLWWLPSWPLSTAYGMPLEKITAFCLCFLSLTWGCSSWYPWKYFEVTWRNTAAEKDSSKCCTYSNGMC